MPAFGEIEPGLYLACCENESGTVKTTLAGMMATDAEGDTAEIVQGMIDYGGTTGGGLQTMLDRGFNETVAAGLEAASAKAAELVPST